MTQSLLPLDTHSSAPTLRFFVPGRPQTAGSKRAFVNPHTGRAAVVDSGDKAAKKTWRGDLREAAADALEEAGGEITMGALKLTIVCVRRRPKGHLSSAGLVKDRYRDARPTARPDTVKLVRAAEDALTSVVWVDDSQVVEHALFKVFGDQYDGNPHTEGMAIEVRAAPPYMR